MPAGSLTWLGSFARGCPDRRLGGVREAQALHLVKALEHKGRLQIAPGDCWRPPCAWGLFNVMTRLRQKLSGLPVGKGTHMPQAGRKYT